MPYLRLLAVLWTLAVAAPAQLITWTTIEDQTSPGCPSAITSNVPHFDNPAGWPWFTSDPLTGQVWMQWQGFDPDVPLMLLISFDISRSFFPPCMLVPPDGAMLFGTSDPFGQANFTVVMPTSPASLVPAGHALQACGQVVDISSIPSVVTSFVFDVWSFR